MRNAFNLIFMLYFGRCFGRNARRPLALPRSSGPVGGMSRIKGGGKEGEGMEGCWQNKQINKGFFA